MSDATATAPAAARTGGKFLTFFLGGEEYGVQILRVQEIIGLLPITRVPRLPGFIRGVVNLRGKVIPIVDLRAKFGLAETETAETCIIVVAIRGVHIGVVVDRVSEVADIAGAEIEDAPDFGASVETEFLLGIGKAHGKVRLLLDIERVLSSEEFAQVREAAPGVGA
ncbi:MAG: chemotaxis protein CheW [Gemmatimonadaceae bacterium]|nr:chemotaxis protein CheW [Gemmatimonadaceae bacterium]